MPRYFICNFSKCITKYDMCPERVDFNHMTRRKPDGVERQGSTRQAVHFDPRRRYRIPDSELPKQLEV